jgi:acyl-CoA reductase-like NAD-dependent aldehyde dehydrogenase
MPVTTTSHRMPIAGKMETTARNFPVTNPATGEVAAEAPVCSHEQLDSAFAAADAAFPEWSADLELRRVAMHAMADAVDAASEELAAILVAEQGKPLGEADFEVGIVGAWLRYYADLETSDVNLASETATVQVLRRPLGPVAAIVPWNFPLAAAIWKIAPSFRAGNTIVLKPSPFTPLTTLRAGEIMHEFVPAGVLNIVSGDDDLGERMTSHPTPRKISFTGSVETGKLVGQAAAKDLKRLTLELGGNDAAIVLEDADVGSIAEDLFWGAFNNNGQVCAAIKRLYVHENRYDDVVDALAVRARNTTVGEGHQTGVELGPINNHPQFERVTELVQQAVAGGATAVTGGGRLGDTGYFFEPTILVDVDETSRIFAEEQFGPALPVVPYKNLEDAVSSANATKFGLGGSVWGTDMERAAEVASRLDCGMAWINAHTALTPEYPHGGVKWSGIGTENGTWGLDHQYDLQFIWAPR